MPPETLPSQKNNIASAQRSVHFILWADHSLYNTLENVIQNPLTSASQSVKRVCPPDHPFPSLAPGWGTECSIARNGALLPSCPSRSLFLLSVCFSNLLLQPGPFSSLPREPVLQRIQIHGPAAHILTCDSASGRMASRYLSACWPFNSRVH